VREWAQRKGKKGGKEEGGEGEGKKKTIKTPFPNLGYIMHEY